MPIINQGSVQLTILGEGIAILMRVVSLKLRQPHTGQYS